VECGTLWNSYEKYMSSTLKYLNLIDLNDKNRDVELVELYIIIIFRMHFLDESGGEVSP
jgi:hypothetical protein